LGSVELKRVTLGETLSKMQVKREAKIYHRYLPCGNTTFRVDPGKINCECGTPEFKTESEVQKFAPKSNAESLRRNLGCSARFGAWTAARSG
jgi:hypothetical protein